MLNWNKESSVLPLLGGAARPECGNGDATEVDVEARPREERLGVLAEQKSALEFVRVFAMSAKLTDLGAEEWGAEECWLWMRIGTKTLDSA